MLDAEEEAGAGHATSVRGGRYPGMHIISSGRSLYLLDQHHLLELEVTRWGIIVRDARGRRIGMLRAVEG